MKKGLIFATTLAMALGVGVAVGAHQNKARAAEAWSGTECGASWYCIGTINGQNWDSWNPFVLNGDRYEYVIDDESQVEFKLVNNNTWEGSIQIHAEYGDDLDWNGKGWKSLTTKNGQNFKTKVAGKYTLYYDKNITEYENGVWAFGIEEYVAPSTKYDVTLHVGDETEVVKVAEGSLPAAKANTYDKTFDGWYTTDAYDTKKTEITANCDVYGRFVDKASAIYTIDDGYAKKFDAYYLYAWNSDGKNNEWPGLAVNGKSITVPTDASFIINDGDTQQTVDISQEGAKPYLKLLNDVDGSGHFEVEWSENATEVPASEGYYIKGSATGWAYVADNKMSTEDLNEGDVAQFIGFEAEANDEIRVCSYYTDRAPFEQWANLQGGQSEVGTLVNNNLKFTAGGTYDIYAKYVNDEFLFDVVAHHEPEPEHEYKYSINGAAAVKLEQNTVPGKETEYLSGALSLKKGDVVTFTKDAAAYAVAPKEDGAYTKVYAVEGGLKFAQDYNGALCLETNGALLWAGQFDAGYYLFGSFNSWNEKLGVKAELEGGVGPAYVISGLELAKDAEVQMISFPAEGKEITNYEADPAKTGSMTEVDFTVITEGVEKGNIHFNKAGTYSIYFNPSDGYYSVEDDNYVEPVYTVKVGETSYNLVPNNGNEYKLDVEGDKISFVHGTSVSVLKDGVLDDSFDLKPIGNNNLDSEYKIIANGEGQIYVDMVLKNVFVGGLPFGGYHLLKNDSVIQMTHIEDFDGYIQYKTSSVQFAVNDTIKFVDTNGGGAEHDYKDLPTVWAIGIINESGLGANFEVVKDDFEKPLYIKCKTACEASVYMKLKTGVDEVYFGDVPEYVHEAMDFANSFKLAMAESCSADPTLKQGLVEEAWAEAAAAYALLSDKAKAELYKGHSSEQAEIREFGERYVGIYQQHGGHWTLTNFLAWDINPNILYNHSLSDIVGGNSTMIIVICVATASALALGMMFLFKKRKQK